jgi:hypothetical protein
MEVWKKYHSYEVSNLGRIKNKHGRIMKLNYDMRGYDKINLYINKKRYSYKIHKLVMLVFKGPRPYDHNRKEHYQIDHINRNKKDNRLCNLRYCTRDENMKNIKIKPKCKRNMNNTDDCSTEDQQQVCIDYIVSLASVSSLFIISEILPFLKGQNNGISECLVKCFEGSDCLLTKLIKLLKPKEEQEEDKPVGNENKNLMKTESSNTAENTNTININVSK